MGAGGGAAEGTPAGIKEASEIDKPHDATALLNAAKCVEQDTTCRVSHVSYDQNQAEDSETHWCDVTDLPTTPGNQVPPADTAQQDDANHHGGVPRVTFSPLRVRQTGGKVVSSTCVFSSVIQGKKKKSAVTYFRLFFPPQRILSPHETVISRWGRKGKFLPQCDV